MVEEGLTLTDIITHGWILLISENEMNEKKNRKAKKKKKFSHFFFSPSNVFQVPLIKRFNKAKNERCLLSYKTSQEKKISPQIPLFCAATFRVVVVVKKSKYVLLFIFSSLSSLALKTREGSQNVNTTLDFSDCFLSYSSYESK